MLNPCAESTAKASTLTNIEFIVVSPKLQYHFNIKSVYLTKSRADIDPQKDNRDPLILTGGIAQPPTSLIVVFCVLHYPVVFTTWCVTSS